MITVSSSAKWAKIFKKKKKKRFLYLSKLYYNSQNKFFKKEGKKTPLFFCCPHKRRNINENLEQKRSGCKVRGNPLKVSSKSLPLYLA